MKKYLFFGGFFLLFFFLPLILAVNLDVQKTSSDEVMIIDLNKPAVFELSIKNNGPTDEFMIYTFFGAGSLPKEKFTSSYSIVEGRTVIHIIDKESGLVLALE